MFDLPFWFGEVGLICSDSNFFTQGPSVSPLDILKQSLKSLGFFSWIPANNLNQIGVSSRDSFFLISADGHTRLQMRGVSSVLSGFPFSLRSKLICSGPVFSHKVFLLILHL